MKKLWRLWALSLGEKAGKHDQEADIIAIVRTVILASYLVTNFFIISGVVRHWHDADCIQQATKKGPDGPFLMRENQKAQNQ